MDWRPRRRRKSSGLGLSIVEKIVQEHCGHLEIESEIGKGTVVTIQLPIVLE